MNSLNYATSYTTATNVLGWPSTVPMSGQQAKTLPRTLISESSPVDLVKAFTMNRDPKGLVLYMLQSLTSDAVATLQSFEHSNVRQYLTALEEILRSYAISLGKICCVNCDDGHESSSSQGSPVDNIPPPAGATRPWTKDQHIMGREVETCKAFSGNMDISLSFPSSHLPVTEHEGSGQSSAPITPQDILPHLQPRHGCLSSVESSETNYQHYQYHSVFQQEPGSPGINAAELLQGCDTTYQPIFTLPGFEPSNQGVHLDTVPLPAVAVASPVFDLDKHSNHDIPRQLRPSPPWLTAPSPSLLPTPSFLIRDAQSSPSMAMDSLPAQNTSFLLDDDDLTWQGLEKAISDARCQADSDHPQTGEPQVSEPSYSDSSLYSGPCSSGLSANAPLVAESKQLISSKHQLFRPFSISPLPFLEPNGSAAAGHPSNLAPFVNVADSDTSDRSGSLSSNYACSDASGYHRSCVVGQWDHSHNHSNPGAGPFGLVPETSLPSPDSSLISSQQDYSTALFMNDDARRHIRAPRPIRAGVGPNFLENSPPPQLSPDVLDRLSLATVGDVCSEITPMLCDPTQQNILTLVEAVFSHVVSTDDADVVTSLLSFIFRFWQDGHIVSSGLRTSTTAMEWIEFTSHSLVTRIRQEFRRIAEMTEIAFPAKVAPIFKFILYLQDLPSVARKAQHTLRTLMDAVLDNHENTLSSACLVAKRVNFLVAYFSISMKGEIVSSRAPAWQTVRSAALSFIHGKLRSFVSLFVESSAREIREPKSVLFLGKLLSRLTSKKVVSKALPIKKLVALLKPPDRVMPAPRPSYVKAAVTFLLTVCSNNSNPGCIVCSKHDVDRSTRQEGGRACACTAYLDLLNYDLDAAKSFIRRGMIKDGFKALLEMDVIEAHVNKFPREQ